jgi:hypothetical protein
MAENSRWQTRPRSEAHAIEMFRQIVKTRARNAAIGIKKLGRLIKIKDFMPRRA